MAIRAKKSARDEYTNRAIVSVTMSAANTLTFADIQFAVGVFQGVACVIETIEYYINEASLRDLDAATHSIYVGISTRDTLTSISVLDNSILDRQQYTGTGVDVEPIKSPLIADFTKLTGGGIITPANPLYLFMTSAALGAAGSCEAVIRFRFIELTDKDYIELIQSQIQANL